MAGSFSWCLHCMVISSPISKLRWPVRVVLMDNCHQVDCRIVVTLTIVGYLSLGQRGSREFFLE